MAKSGSMSISLYGATTIELSWELTGQSGMESTISWTVKTGTGWTSHSSFEPHGGGFAARCYVRSEVDNRSFVIWSMDGYDADDLILNYKIGEGSFTISRDVATNTGAFSMTLERSPGYINGTTWQAGTTKTNNYTINTLTTSGAGAQISSVSDFTDETSPVVTYAYDKGTRVATSKVSMAISFTGATDNIPYREVPTTGTSYTFNFTQPELNTLYTLLRSGETASVRFLIKTEETLTDGEVLQPKIISFPKTFKFVNYKPLLQPEVWDINPATIAVTNDANVLVKYMSNVNYDMNVTLSKGGLDIIGSYVSNGGTIVEGFTAGNYGAPTSNTFYFSATDDRVHTGTETLSLSSFDGEFIEYIKLTNSLKCTPISGEGKLTATVSGLYFSAKFGPKGLTNKMTLKYKVYKRGEEVEWTTATEITPQTDGNGNYTYSFDITGLDYTKQHIVEVSVADLLMSAESSVSAMAKPVFYWNNDSFVFNVPVTIEGATLDSLVEEDSVTGYYMSSNAYTLGTYTWYYRKWSSGLLECWCTVPVTTMVNTPWGNMYVASTSSVNKTDLCYPTGARPKETPLVIASLGGGPTKGMLITDNSYAADTISTGRYNIASPVAITSSTTFRINYYVRGRWK